MIAGSPGRRGAPPRGGAAALAGLAAVACASALAAGGPAGRDKVRLPVGEFTARRLDPPPVIDGRAAPGEWDRAFSTSGMMTPFGHELHEAVTEASFGYDEEKFYFLIRCVRGDREWKLWKSVRENDGYSFGDPSIEIWVTPPALVPETYQNVINTYPAVLDQKMIPTRGYTAQGWKGNWDLGVTESDTEYTIEAAIPISDFEGFATVKEGDVWRFLVCRTSPRTKPRAQASWSITQGFAELGQHPKVTFGGDSAAVRLRGTTTAFTGRPRFTVTVVAPDRRRETVDVALRWHGAKVFGDADRIERRRVKVRAGGSADVVFEGAPPADTGNLTITATTRAGALLFRQSFPYVVNGWTPKKPARPAKAREAKELDLRVMFGPESNVMILRADIIDLPGRERAAGGTIRLVDPATGKAVLEEPLPEFREWYSNAHFSLDKMNIPVADYKRLAQVERQNRSIGKENKKRKARGEKPLALKEVEVPEPKTVLVEVTVTDREGAALRTETAEVDLRRYRFVWEGNSVGVTDEVIPPWTPVTWRDGTVGVWNRVMKMNGLGLLDSIDNGGTDQVRSMRLVAVSGGARVEIAPSAPELVRLVDAAATLRGEGTGAGLSLSAETRVEFDGFVLSDLTIGPAAGEAEVEKLFLEVVLPEEEASHFCTTAGGWAAAHAETPAYWSSRKTSSGMLVGDFVPYIWLTNSDRAFLWFADNDRGWITDDDKGLPTQEVVRAGGAVTLRVHFIEVPTTLTGNEKTTVRWGYQAFPSRPLPKGWRSIICSQGTTHLPSARNTYFWFDGNWAVLWPYYSSPYPWSMEKSKDQFDRYPRRTIHRPMPGSIAHSIARYRDYEGHEFKEYVVDWGSTPGDPTNGNVTQSKGANDFRVWHYRQWVRDAGFRGLYVDENYIGIEKNFITGGAYHRPDGRLQPGYSYLGLREYFKRMKVMFHEEGVPAPNLWQHVSSGAAYHSWLGDVFFEGENVEPTDLRFDYIEVLPAGRMRAIASAKCSGGVMTMMCQSQRHATKWEPKHTHQFLGWVMAHDILPEQVREYGVIAQEARLYEDEVDFVGYWRPGSPFRTSTPECVVSAHRVGPRALLWIVNTARRDRQVEVEIDWRAAGTSGSALGRTEGAASLAPDSCVAVNAETGEIVPLTPRGLAVPVLERDFVAVHLIGGADARGLRSFRATFERGIDADEAWGSPVLVPAGRGGTGPALTQGRTGLALDVSSQAVALWPHLHVTDAEGRLVFQAKLAAGRAGTIFSNERPNVRNRVTPGAAAVSVAVEKDALVFGRVPGRGEKRDDGQVRTAVPAPGWHEFDLAWKDGTATLQVDGVAVGTIPVEGMNVCGSTGKALLESGRFVFGDGRGAAAAVDEIVMYRSAR